MDLITLVVVAAVLVHLLFLTRTNTNDLQALSKRLDELEDRMNRTHRTYKEPR